MYRQLFAPGPLMMLPLAALVIFLAVFTAVVVRAWRRAPVELERAARLPLAEGDDHG